ncbi:MAG: LytTR family DNA-binding domain-containing protein [Pseudomonadota bacterium]
MYRVLVVDDEAPARSRLSKAIKSVSNVTLIGEAASGEDAVQAIVSKKPDVVFLDVEMPHGDGFFVVEEGMKRGMTPEIIFVTAYDRFAVDAFECGAIDYLLKPTEMSRIEVALERAIERLQQRSASERIVKMQTFMEARRARAAAESSEEDDLWLKDRGQTHRVPLSSVLYIEADRDYVKVETSETSYHVRGTIADYERRLSDSGFLRIHRSIVVRKGAVTSLVSKGQNAYDVALSNEKTLTVGRSFNKAAKSAFGLI